MGFEERELARIAGEIAGRIQRVCKDFPHEEFRQLCMKMARVQRRGEHRGASSASIRSQPWSPVNTMATPDGK